MDIIETKRLRLDQWSKKDAEDLYQYAKNPAVGPAAGWKPHSDVKESKLIIKKVFIPADVWKIVLKETGKPIGTISFDIDKRRPNINSKELGYSLDQNYWNKGLMTEAADAVIEYGFNVLKLDIISITTGTDNLQSRRVIEKLGFRYEGTQRHSYRIYDNSIRDLMCYSLFKEEWLELQK